MSSTLLVISLIRANEIWGCYLCRFKDIFQYVYSNVYPEVYATNEKRGFDLKSNFHILFKTYRDKMSMRQQVTAKNPVNYKTERKETCEFEQKPIKNFNKFNDVEEEELKQKAEKRNAMRWEKLDEVKAKKQKLKDEETKIKEGKI